MPRVGGKRKINKSLKDWVSFVKKVQKEEKLSYKDAIHRAKVRKDKGEKWMTGGDNIETEEFYSETNPETYTEEPVEEEEIEVEQQPQMNSSIAGGRRTRRRSRSRSRTRARSARRGRSRSRH